MGVNKAVFKFLALIPAITLSPTASFAQITPLKFERFTIDYLHEPQNPNSLSHNDMEAILEAHHGVFLSL